MKRIKWGGKDILEGQNSFKDTCWDEKIQMIDYSRRSRRKTRQTKMKEEQKCLGTNTEVLTSEFNWGFWGENTPNTECRKKQPYTRFLHAYMHPSLFNEHQTHVNKMGETSLKRHPQYGRCPSSLSFTKTTPLIFLLSLSLWRYPHNECGLMSVVPTLLHVLLSPGE